MEDLNETRIKRLEETFRSTISLCQEGRKLVGEGEVKKICRKNPQPRQYFSPFVVSLADIEISDIPDSPEYEYAWNIHTPKKSFKVCAIDDTEKRQWMHHINKYADEYKKLLQCDGPNELAPTWIPDSSVETCMHHCRMCGCVACGDCTSNKIVIKNISSSPVRVCSECFKNPNSTRKGPR
ncbi:hypothetical protein RF11_06740 [Thelohanellus kitauei]|uniref:FYVE-type domain-containing protein n=1 Tax=Thelohanellus kitauei TaxID=669202 RepID=A0A0C2JGF0_THEKT|nr:hypothetical protein RF11_06740 [Thelohanellus kitauei]